MFAVASMMRPRLPFGTGAAGARWASTQQASHGVGYRPGDLIPSLAGLIPKLPGNSGKKASKMPWVESAEGFVATWTKIAPCMPKYMEFLEAHKAAGDLGKGFEHDLRTVREGQAGQVMTEEAQAALAEFYLAVALKLRPAEIEAAGSDNQALLRVAQKCAEEDFEPFVERARAFVADYDSELHAALEETCPLYEVDDGLFWRANFDVTAPAEFHHFLTALGHGSGAQAVPGQAHVKQSDVQAILESAERAIAGGEASAQPAARAAEVVYDKWLLASSMPVKASISRVLMEHGLLVAQDVHTGEKLLPEVPAVWEQPGEQRA